MPPPPSFYSRRRFLRQLAGAGGLAATGLGRLLADLPAPPAARPEAFRFAFVTDLHLIRYGARRSVEGIAMCLAAVEKLNPRPDFILAGGDLAHELRRLAVPEAEEQMRLFLKIWKDSTSLPTHWIFGNHDLVSTSDPNQAPDDPLYGKELFRRWLNVPQLNYGFDHRGWRFIVLDDISLQPDHNYIGRLADQALSFARGELDAHRSVPTIVATHIPLYSYFSFGVAILRKLGPWLANSTNLVCSNSGALTAAFPGHDVRAVLCGHLHHYEKLMVDGIPYINSGAVCGNYWQGPMLDCPEGFGVVDVGADGSFDFKYQAYGWKA